jgi:hypothetical protein
MLTNNRGIPAHRFRIYPSAHGDSPGTNATTTKTNFIIHAVEEKRLAHLPRRRRRAVRDGAVVALAAPVERHVVLAADVAAVERPVADEAGGEADVEGALVF